jgi:hypothetical protein
MIDVTDLVSRIWIFPAHSNLSRFGEDRPM